MPICDNDGTTTYETAAVCDNDGTTTYETAAVYDNDGTTNYLIWEARKYLIQDGQIQSAITGGMTLYQQQYASEWAQGNGYIRYINTQGGSISRVDTNKEIDYTPYHKIIIDAELAPHVAGRVGDLTIVAAHGSPPTDKWVPFKDGQYYKRQVTVFREEFRSRKQYVFDLSGISGWGKLLLGINDISDEYRIYNIWLE